jgi:uncharacterized protein DUF4159
VRYLPLVITRRELLVGAAALLAARKARAIGPGTKFRFGQLQLGTGTSWNPRPSALKRMAWEIEKRTSVDVELEPAVVAPTSDTLHETPFGGLLLVDSAEGSPDGAFDSSLRKLVSAIFPSPAKGLEIVPADHVVYKSFYLLDKPLGRLAIQPAMEGVTQDGRLVLAYVANDLGGAWARDDFGNYDFPCEPGGEKQRELAFRMGVNLVMYALCLDYKSDQVHVPFIMKRRRWKPEE